MFIITNVFHMYLCDVTERAALGEVRRKRMDSQEYLSYRTALEPIAFHGFLMAGLLHVVMLS